MAINKPVYYDSVTFALIPDAELAFRSVKYPVTQVSTTYAALATDGHIHATTGTFTVTLPTAVGINGKVYTISNGGTGIVTLETTSSQTISGDTTQVVNQYEALSVQSDGANWIAF